MMPTVVAPQMKKVRRQQPEDAGARPRRAARRASGRTGCRRAAGGARPRSAPNGRDAAVGGVVADEQQRHRDGDGGREATSAAAHSQPASRVANARDGRNTSWPEAYAAERSPVARPRRTTNHRVATIAASGDDRHPGGSADHDAPEQVELPQLGHRDRRRGAGRHRRQRDDDHPPHPEPVHQRRRERRHHAEQDQVDPDRERDLVDAPPELVAERLDHDRRRRTHPGSHEQHEERRPEDDPGGMDAGPSQLRLASLNCTGSEASRGASAHGASAGGGPPTRRVS